LETILGDPERARAVFELAITQQALDMPEVLWKTYIDFEVELGEIDNARNLYRRLLERTSHPKVWLAFAKFEQSQGWEFGRLKIFRTAHGVFSERNCLLLFN